MSSVLLTDAKTRLVAIAKECLANLSTPVIAGGVPYAWHTEPRFPYFTCVTTFDTVEFDSEDFDRDTYQLVLRLIIGHLTAEYEGVNEVNLDTWIPALKTYINSRENLQSVAHPVALSGLIRARVTSISGLTVFQSSGIATQQIGTSFTTTCEFDETITQAYL